MNSNAFLSRWNQLGLQRQLLTLLMATAKLHGTNGQLEIPLEVLDEISAGESLASFVEGSKLVLRYSPEQTQLFTIKDETSSSWRTSDPTSSSIPAINRNTVLSDEALAEREEQSRRISNLREEARRKRSQPLAVPTPPVT